MSKKENTKKEPKKVVSKVTPQLKTSKVAEVASVLRTHCVKIRAMQTLLKAKQSESKVISDYVNIRSKDVKDVKDLKEISDVSLLQEQLLAMRAVARAAIGSNLIKLKMNYEINSTGTVSTAYGVSHPLAADNSSEFSALSGLYDEYRVLGGNVKFQTCNNQGAPSTNSVWMAMGYDSMYDTSPTSVVEVLESSQSRLYGTAPQIANNYWAPYTAEAKGYFEFHFTVPKGPALAATTVTGGDGVNSNFPGQWIAAVSQAGTSVGFLRTYVQNPGTSNTIFLRAIVTLDVEWRERT